MLVAASTTEAAVTVRGRIATPDGAPAAGVEVRLLRQTNAFQFNRLLAEGAHYPAAESSTTTSADGRYEVRAPGALLQ